MEKRASEEIPMPFLLLSGLPQEPLTACAAEWSFSHARSKGLLAELAEELAEVLGQ